MPTIKPQSDDPAELRRTATLYLEQIDNRGELVYAARNVAATVDGTNYLVQNSPFMGINWGEPYYRKNELRVTWGFNVTAVGGATSILVTLSLYNAVRKVGSAAGTFTDLTAYNPGLTTGFKVTDTGWLAMSAFIGHGWGIYGPSYRVDFLTGAPTIQELNVAIYHR